MTTLETILLTLLSIDAIALTVLVLLQQGKGADVGAAFGSGSSNTVFGASGSAPFRKIVLVPIKMRWSPEMILSLSCRNHRILLPKW